MRKRYWLSTMTVTATMAALAGMPVLGQQSPEQQVMALANADRAQHGLAPLKWDPVLAQAAAEHAQLMAQQPALSHQYPGEPDLAARAGAAGAHFRSIAENVALAPNPEALEQEWMHSPPHRANILNPSMTTIGVGLVQRGGNYYAVQDFAATVAEMGPDQIEQKIGQLLQQRGLQPAGMTQDARQTCEMDHGAASILDAQNRNDARRPARPAPVTSSSRQKSCPAPLDYVPSLAGRSSAHAPRL